MSENIYYVYVYLRARDSIVASAGTPYYVGKGKKGRVYAKHNVAVPKDHERIKFIVENITEDEAFALERQLIAQYGRVDLGTGILRNVTDGGEGTSGWIPSQEYRNNLSIQRLGKSYEERYGEEKAELIKEKLSLSVTGEKNGFYGKKHSESVKQLARELREGKTYEEIMGLELAKKVKIKKSEFMTGREPGNKGKTLEELHSREKAEEIRQKIIDASIGENNPMYGKMPSFEQLERKRLEKLNQPKIQCPHCKKIVDTMNYNRWHGDKCKLINPRSPIMKLLCVGCNNLFAYNTIGQHQKKCMKNK